MAFASCVLCNVSSKIVTVKIIFRREFMSSALNLKCYIALVTCVEHLNGLCMQWVPFYWLCLTKKRAGSKPVAKLSDRSAIRKKVVFFAGSVWSWPRSEGEVGRDQEPPGDTSRHPIPWILYKTWYGQQLLKTVKYVRSVTKKIPPLRSLYLSF